MAHVVQRRIPSTTRTYLTVCGSIQQPTNHTHHPSTHEFRRAARLMPAQLMELMRHESIETTLRFYVGTDARAKAEAVWVAFEALQRVFSGS